MSNILVQVSLMRLKPEDFIHMGYSQIGGYSCCLHVLVIVEILLFLESMNIANQLLCVRLYSKFFHVNSFLCLFKSSKQL